MAPYVLKLPTYLFECADYLAPIFEIVGFFFLFKGKKHWLLYLIIGSCFHLINLLVLNLGFTLTTLSFGVFLISPVLYQIYLRSKEFFERYGNYLVILVILLTLAKVGLILTDSLEFRYRDFSGSYLDVELIIDLFLWILCACSGLYLFFNYNTLFPHKMK